MNETIEKELMKEIDELRSKEEKIRILRQKKEEELYKIIMKKNLTEIFIDNKAETSDSLNSMVDARDLFLKGV